MKYETEPLLLSEERAQEAEGTAANAETQVQGVGAQ